MHEVEALRPGESSPEWRLRIVTGLPKGSTCSREDGYSVARPSRLEFAVVITHREIGEGPAICTADYPYVETIIPLGPGLEEGETYTATVNRDARVTFTPPPSHFTPTFTETVESPIHEVELLTLESHPVQRQLRVVAGWPTGSGCSAANGYALVPPLRRAHRGYAHASRARRPGHRLHRRSPLRGHDHPAGERVRGGRPVLRAAQRRSSARRSRGSVRASSVVCWGLAAVGLWRSWGARLNGIEEVGGSNPPQVHQPLPPAP